MDSYVCILLYFAHIACVKIYMSSRTHTHTPTHTHTYTHTHSHTHIYTQTHIHTHTHANTHNHAHTPSLSFSLSHTHTHTHKTFAVCVDGAEECDDGNNVAGDGCSSTCRVEEGYRCFSNCAGRDLCRAICGGSPPPPAASYSDHPPLSSWSSLRHTETHCNTMQHTATHCNIDGRQTFLEECDDSNTESGDGCSSTCSVEDGFFCIYGSALRYTSVCMIWLDHICGMDMQERSSCVHAYDICKYIHMYIYVYIYINIYV